MNVSQYSLNEDLARDAIVSLAYLPSIEESIGASAGSEEDGAEVASDDPEILSVEISGAICEYSVLSDGSAHIVRCATDADELDLPDEIEGHPVPQIGAHALCTCYDLERASFPARLESIGEYAFMNTALREVELPATVRYIGKNAFYKCAHLTCVRLPEGLRAIGKSAFRESALKELVIPTTVGFIGQDAFKETALVFVGPGQTLRIAEGNSHYLIEGGVLYAQGEAFGADGTSGSAAISAEGAGAGEGPDADVGATAGEILVQALDAQMRDFQGHRPVRSVMSRAFAGLKSLRRVAFAEDLEEIGDEAFKGCLALERAELPDSLRRIGKLAFMDTSLAGLRIPAQLEEAGTAAFYTGGSVARNFERTIREVEIAPANQRFYLRDGMLCERREQGDAVLLYVGHDELVYIPDCVTMIGTYAFLNCSFIRQLRIHDGLRAIDVGGFDFGGTAPSVVYEVTSDPERAGERSVVSYPPGQAGYQAARQAFSRGYFDLHYAFAGADNAILVTRDTYVRGRAILERLRNPVMLDARMRDSFLKNLRRAPAAMAVAFGKAGFVQGVDWLFEEGIIDSANIDFAIETASEAGEVAVLSRLVQLRRTACDAPMFDFDL